jgi:hypothetical protein
MPLSLNFIALRSEKRSRGESVIIVTRLRAGRPGFDSRQGRIGGIFLLATMSESTFGPKQPSTQWVRGLFPQGQDGLDVKLATHPHLMPRLRMLGAVSPLPPHVCMA